MPAIVSPKPRHATVDKPRVLDIPVVHTPPIYIPSEPRSMSLLSPPRLMSPINLSSSGIPNSKPSKFQLHCSSTKRRRACASSNSRNTRRRHPCPTEGPFPSFVDGPPVFDSLPWISQVEMPPECVNVWDIADLSLLPIKHQEAHPSRCSHPSSGIGPVRHRKSSLRSAGNLYNKEAFPSVIQRGHPPASSRLLPAFDGPSLNPRTPPPMVRLNSDEPTFRNLMPAFSIPNGTRGHKSTSISVPIYPRGSSATPSP